MDVYEIQFREGDRNPKIIVVRMQADEH